MRFRRIIGIVPIVVFLVAWQILANNDLINSALFSDPVSVANELVVLYAKELPTRSLLFENLWATFQRVFLSFAFGTLIGILFGILMGISRSINNFFSPLITLIMPIPGIAMAPLFIIWMGFGDRTIIAVGILAAFFPVVHNMVVGIRSIDKNVLHAAQIMGADKKAILLHIYIPSSSAYLLTGAKLGLARCWRTIIAVEFIAATNFGLGYMIWDAASNIRSDTIYAGILIMIATYFVLEKGIGIIENMTINKWGIFGE